MPAIVCLSLGRQYVADADVLRTAARVAYQAAIALGLPGVQRLLQRFEHQIRLHRTAHAPTYDAPREAAQYLTHRVP